jgi:hypothetical protein
MVKPGSATVHRAAAGVAILVAPVVNAGHAEEVVPAIVVNDLIGGAVDDYEAISLGVGNLRILHCDSATGAESSEKASPRVGSGFITAFLHSLALAHVSVGVRTFDFIRTNAQSCSPNPSWRPSKFLEPARIALLFDSQQIRAGCQESSCTGDGSI